MFSLSDEEIQRYSRHVVLPHVGGHGQNKLKNSKVLVVGSGGLGSPVLFYLTAAGVGNITLIDFDEVDLSNLQRQILHFTPDVGKQKTISAKEKLNNLNPNVKITSVNSRLTPKNVLNILQGHDFVIECSDNFETKYLVNDTCQHLEIPVTIAGVHRYDGQVITILPRQTACYRCLFPKANLTDPIPNPSEAGLLGVVPGLVGCIQATEALKYLLGIGDLLTDTLLYVSVDSFNFEKISIHRNPACVGCHPPYTHDSVKASSVTKSTDALIKIPKINPLNDPDFDIIINTLNLKSPLPFVYVKLALESKKPGDQLKILFSDEKILHRTATLIQMQKLANISGFYPEDSSSVLVLNIPEKR